MLPHNVEPVVCSDWLLAESDLFDQGSDQKGLGYSY